MNQQLVKHWQPRRVSLDKDGSASEPSAGHENTAYSRLIEIIREEEYPTLSETVYLDHAGTTPYAKSAIETWTSELTANLFGNPHSASASSQSTTRRIDDIRLRVLRFFKADPEDFDLVFVANATAAIKLVAEAFRDNTAGFSYCYHNDAHTSLVGCRELASRGVKCFVDDQMADEWVGNIKPSQSTSDIVELFAFPGQSNMTGRRLSMKWCEEVRRRAREAQRRIYTLLDAASLVSTAPLDLSDCSIAPDFTALSFYKIFGFPDLGALLVRKRSGNVLMQKRYFAGGTVDAVAGIESGWHAKKSSIHAALEEGTLPFHNILALDHAMNVHQKLFGSMTRVSTHTRLLAQEARNMMKAMRHSNGRPVCELYGCENAGDYGPVIAFNLKNSAGRHHSAAEVEKLCTVKGIQLRTGGLCNPGGILSHLGLTDDQVRAAYNAGKRCGGDDDMIDGRPSGMVRISFGAMSVERDVQAFLSFVKEYFVERDVLREAPALTSTMPGHRGFFIESLSVFPIKSCAAFEIPADQRWPVSTKGLKYDREWCLVHEGTNVALSQKKYPQMALFRPEVDLARRVMIVSYGGGCSPKSIMVDLDDLPSSSIISGSTCQQDAFRLQKSKVCGDELPLHVYTSENTNNFFSNILKVPCCLARYARSSQVRTVHLRRPKGEVSPSRSAEARSSVMLANESPLLIVSRSSINELNRQIQVNALLDARSDPMRISASSFRANLIVAECSRPQEAAHPYDEDSWLSASIRTPSEDNPSLSSVCPVPAEHERDTESGSELTPLSSLGSFIPSTSASQTTSDKSSSHSISNGQPLFAPEEQLCSSPRSLKLHILGPCQRCQMVSIDQATALPQQEPFSTLAKTRRKGDGRVWFGVHACLDASEQEAESYMQVGDLVQPQFQ